MAFRAITNVKETVLRCPICWDSLQNPRVLTCQHTFCIQCLVGIISESRKQSGHFNTFQCPVCRNEIRYDYKLDSDKVAENFPVSSFVEAITQTVNRYESPELSCGIHGKRPMEFYCLTDKLILCSRCLFDNHRECIVETLPEYFEKNKNQLKKIKEELVGQINEMDQIVTNLHKRKIYEQSIEQTTKDLDNLQITLGLFYQYALDELDEIKQTLENVSHRGGICQDRGKRKLKSEVEKTKTELENLDKGVKFFLNFDNLKRQKDDLVSKFKLLKEKYETNFKVSFDPKSYLKDLNVNSKPLLGTIRYQDEEVK